MSERRIKKSHPDYEEINSLSNDLAILKNQHCFFNIRYGKFEGKEADATEQIIRDRLESRLKGGIFRDFLDA